MIITRRVRSRLHRAIAPVTRAAPQPVLTLRQQIGQVPESEPPLATFRGEIQQALDDLADEIDAGKRGNDDNQR